ncbi:hypothetical protein [Sulfurimonas sp. HSL-1716]|uniref:hypothetical protein n=1 Tax=Hydrocurvibacter sulfurireducens TaxID=3131937 RepID=UPI0031F8181F
MIRFILFVSLIFCFSYAQDAIVQSQDTQQTNPKVVYLSYDSVPQRVINGEIFPVTIKSLSTKPNYQEITFSFENGSGVNLIEESSSHTKNGKYFYDTFYFQAEKNDAILPDFIASVSDANGAPYPTTTRLKGQDLNVITLNPKDTFSNIIADSFSITNYKITSYDKNFNIVLFTAVAARSDLSNFHINNVAKQGIESLDNNFMSPKVTYYAIIRKDIENFTFSYFNLQEQRFKKISLPVVVDDDRVTTQSDLKPKDQQFSKIKIAAAAFVLVVLLILVLWKKKYIYLIFLIIPIGYIVYALKPSQIICVKEGSNIYLLPLKNGTVFEQLPAKNYLEVEGTTKGYKKIKLDNNKIGWVNNEDICSN